MKWILIMLGGGEIISSADFTSVVTTGDISLESNECIYFSFSRNAQQPVTILIGGVSIDVLTDSRVIHGKQYNNGSGQSWAFGYLIYPQEKTIVKVNVPSGYVLNGTYTIIKL